MPHIGEAIRALSNYNGFLPTLPNPDVLLSPILTKEAVLSSRIEGTQVTLDEVLKHDAGFEERVNFKDDDMEEVRNYRDALKTASAEVHHRGLSLSLIKQTHHRLMLGVRGQNKSPGLFRESQNWIGSAGDTIEKARFVPPETTIMLDALLNLEEYLNVNPTNHLPVVQASIAHAQFEMIHPFNDGNGRVGRILIPLILHKEGTLTFPVFYLSEYLESHRDEYYERLLKISQEGDWHGWIIFFLKAISHQAHINLSKAIEIKVLYEKLKTRFQEVTHSQYSVAALDAFFSLPFINGPDFQKFAGMNNKATARKILMQLIESSLIVKVRPSGGRTPAIYAIPDYIGLFID